MVRLVDVVAVHPPDLPEGGKAEHAFRHSARVGRRVGTVKEEACPPGRIQEWRGHCQALPARRRREIGETAAARRDGSGTESEAACRQRVRKPEEVGTRTEVAQAFRPERLRRASADARAAHGSFHLPRRLRCRRRGAPRRRSRRYRSSRRTAVTAPNGSGSCNRARASRSSFRCQSNQFFAYQSRTTWGRYTSPASPADVHPSWV